jgi:hypothetical protein
MICLQNTNFGKHSGMKLDVNTYNIVEAYRYADLLDHAEFHQCFGLGNGDDSVAYGWPLAENPCHDAACMRSS